jgi:hypothetical protein
MKKLLLLLLCLPLLFSCGEQDTKVKTSTTSFNHQDKDDLIEQFNRDMKRTTEASNNKDWDVVFDIAYPKLFDMASKEQLVKVFESLFDVYKDFQLRPSNIIDIYPIVNYEGDQFTRFFYDNEVIFTFYNTDDLDNTLPVFIDEYGEDNVKAFRNTNSISIKMKSSQLAVLQENSSEWKYLEWKEGQEEVFKQYDIIPVSVLEKLKE